MAKDKKPGFYLRLRKKYQDYFGAVEALGQACVGGCSICRFPT